MFWKNSFAFIAVSLFSLFPLSGCSEKEENISDDVFDVQFVVPNVAETSTGFVTFTVIDGKAPFLTDSFIFEPVSGSVVSYPCAITETSSESFTVEVSGSCLSGRYNIYIRRGSQSKPFGTLYLSLEVAKVGKTLPKWFEGEMDIHFINTGRGECTYQILPDGTTFLVDASGGLAAPEGLERVPWMPNENITAGQVIVDYINHFAPSVSVGHLNYFLLTHHHDDHMGTVDSSSPYHSSNLFRLSSLPEVGSKLVMDKMFDRDWPDFSYPYSESDAMMDNYKAFLAWTASANGTVIEKWKVGSRSQVTPVNSSDWDVVIRSYAGSGYFWTGERDEETFTLMPEDFSSLSWDDIPGENVFSCAYILSYGKFDFFLGGDLEPLGTSYFDAETPLADIVYKVEVMKANHHGHSGSQSVDLINKLAPDVWVVGSWTKTRQPDPGPISRVLDANPNCDVFCINQTEDNIKLIGEDSAAHIMGVGHIVVRVTPGGDSYTVYALDDSDEEYIVKSIHGPYTCVY